MQTTVCEDGLHLIRLSTRSPILLVLHRALFSDLCSYMCAYRQSVKSSAQLALQHHQVTNNTQLYNGIQETGASLMFACTATCESAIHDWFLLSRLQLSSETDVALTGMAPMAKCASSTILAVNAAESFLPILQCVKSL